MKYFVINLPYVVTLQSIGMVRSMDIEGTGVDIFVFADLIVVFFKYLRSLCKDRCKAG